MLAANMAAPRVRQHSAADMAALAARDIGRRNGMGKRCVFGGMVAALHFLFTGLGHASCTITEPSIFRRPITREPADSACAVCPQVHAEPGGRCGGARRPSRRAAAGALRRARRGRRGSVRHTGADRQASFPKWCAFVAIKSVPTHVACIGSQSAVVADSAHAHSSACRTFPVVLRVQNNLWLQIFSASLCLTEVPSPWGRADDCPELNNELNGVLCPARRQVKGRPQQGVPGRSTAAQQPGGQPATGGRQMSSLGGGGSSGGGKSHAAAAAAAAGRAAPGGNRAPGSNGAPLSGARGRQSAAVAPGGKRKSAPGGDDDFVELEAEGALQEDEEMWGGSQRPRKQPTASYLRAVAAVREAGALGMPLCR